jgi:hypothetical protein
MKVNHQRAAGLSFLALSAAAALCSVWAVAAQASRYGRHSQISGLIDRCRTMAATRPDPSKSASAARNPLVEKILQRNVFSPPPVASAERPFGVRLVGVLGEEALFEGNQSAKVGGMIGPARVAVIGADWVELEHKGKTIRLEVFGQGGMPAGPPTMTAASGPSPSPEMMAGQPGPGMPTPAMPIRVERSGADVPADLLRARAAALEARRSAER